MFPNFFGAESLSLGAGLGAGYFQYEFNSKSYNTFDAFVFLNLHFRVCNNFEAFVGYLPGYYFGDKFDQKSNFSGYEGFHSNGFLGVKYDILDGFGIYSKVSSDKFVSFGLAYKF